MTTVSSTSNSSAILYLVLLILLTLLVAIGIGLFMMFARRRREEQQLKRALNSVCYEVRLPKANDVDVHAAEQMFAALTSISSVPTKWHEKLFKTPNYVSFEIVGLPESIRFYVIVPKKISQLVEKQIHASYQEADVKEVDEYNIFHEDSVVEYAGLKLAEVSYKPIKVFSELHVDTMSAVTTAMSRMNEGEGVAVQILITPASKKWRKAGRSFIKSVRDSGSSEEGKKSKPRDDESVGSVEKKTLKVGFLVDIRVVAASKTIEVAKMHVENVLASFDPMELQGSNRFKKVKFKNEKQKKQFEEDFIYRNPRQTTTLNTEELATVFHFPNKNVQTPYIHWLLSKRAPASEEVPSGPPGVWLGNSIFRGSKKQVWIAPDDRRRHMYMVGKTGAGKSYAMQSMIIQDIKQGHGIAYLDPHGDAAEWVLERIPSERAEDVIYFNPADVERPLAFNIVEAYSEDDKHRVANSFIGLLYKMFDPNKQGIVGPRLERSVRNALLTVMSRPGGTLVEVARILYDYQFLKKMYLPYIQDPLVREYWEKEIAQTNEFHKSEVLGYIISKFDRFITNRMMRNILGQSVSSFDFRKVMDEQKILIVNLSKGLVGEENAQFLGLLLIPKILSAAMSRADMNESDRKDFYLYVDEFQNFASEEFAQILSEARKYRLNLIIGNQYIAQIDEKIKHAVFGNVGTMLSFKVGVEDASYLQNEFAPIFSQNDLINLENFNAYIKLLVNGEYPPPFSMSTFYDSVKPTIIAGTEYPVNERTFRNIKELSRLRYGRDRNAVDQEIQGRGRM
ncbi:type IV secretory system conjugative DNA transfer family protein [bacterium]|nr:MAG: type IV secretory system conjugative DNA transfer family protein [bacterium]